MKTRKIWAIPIALVALLMLAAVAFALTTKDTIPDQTLTLGNQGDQGTTVEINLDDLNGSVAGTPKAFEDNTAPSDLTYTALTRESNTVHASFASGAISNTSGLSVTPGNTQADEWWNTLTCTKQNNALFSSSDTRRDTDSADTSGVCQDFSALSAENVAFTVDVDGDNDVDNDDAIGAQVLVVHAFHWDMLTGAQMSAAAKAGGLSGNYGSAFSGLTDQQKLNVTQLYEHRNPTTSGTPAVHVSGRRAVLAAGTGTLTLSTIPTDNTNAGEIGYDAKSSPYDSSGTIQPTDVTVSASDADGRFLTSSVSQTFAVTVMPIEVGNITPLSTGGDANTPPTAFGIPAGTDNNLSFRPATTGDNAVTARLTVRIDPDEDEIVDVTVATSNTPLTRFHQKLNFSLINGADLGFTITKSATALNEANIKKNAGVTLTPGQRNDFTLVVNEYDNAPNQSQEMLISVIAVTDNVAPSFASGVPTTATVAERAKNAAIASFPATDPNNQGLTYSIDPKAGDAGAMAVAPSLEIDSSGDVTTNSDVETPDDQPDYIEDDPDTAAVDESMNCGADSDETCNAHVFVVTVSDGTLSTKHEFTLTVTDEDDPVTGSDQKLTVSEDNAGKVDDNTLNSFGMIEIGTSADGNYSLGQQIDNKGNISESDAGLFGVDERSGALYLKEAGSIDYESGIVTFTLTVKRGQKSKIAVISVTDVNEAPQFSDDDNKRVKQDADGNDIPIGLYVLESATLGTAVSIGQAPGGSAPSGVVAKFTAEDEDSKATGNNISYALLHDHDNDADTDEVEYSGKSALFRVSDNGTVQVNSGLDTDADDATSVITLTLRAYDPGTGKSATATLKADLPIRVTVIDTNVAPEFDATSKGQTHKDISESEVAGYVVYTYHATDADNDPVKYRLRDQDDTSLFSVGETSGVLTLAAPLDYEAAQTHTVEVQAYDTDGDTDEVVLTVTVLNANDNSPVFEDPSDNPREVTENKKRGEVIGSYPATDGDGDTVTYSLTGANAKSFDIDEDGDLLTLESLDYDSKAATPCPSAGCVVVVNASDGGANAKSGMPVGHTGVSTFEVRIIVQDAEDSVSTLKVTKANPVPGTAMGDAMSALTVTKTTLAGQTAVQERPGDLPATTGATTADGKKPLNFVETEWGSWGTVLRIEVTSESPDASCGAGPNRCVVVNVKSDSADHSLALEAYRSADKENKFVAAMKLVERDDEKTVSSTAVYKHSDGGVARLQVDEEDEIEIKFGNLRSSVDVENEAPEIGNFSPAHEMAFDDEDVEYTFTVTDGISGLPDPEDLPDMDGDADYMPVVALISRNQCESVSGDADDPKGMSMAATIDDDRLYCPGTQSSGEFVAGNSDSFGFAPIRDDKDFDDVDNGYDVETTIVLTENKTYYVTFIVCDNAGNCAFHDPDGNNDKKELAQITVDKVAPDLVEARTGVMWDSTDNEYDDDRAFIQAIFNELTQINPATVEVDDFVVEGHTIKAVHVFETPDDEDVTWSASGDFGRESSRNLRGEHRYRDIENTVFIELEDDLLADEEPKVSLVPNGIEDAAQNDQDDDEVDSDDWIAPKFTIVSIVSPRETTQSQTLAGDDDEVIVTVTSDERLKTTRPTVSVTYVNAPDGSVDTKGVETCDTAAGADKGKRKRGEIVNSDKCQDSGAAKGDALINSIEKVSNTEWIVTVTEPKDTGYYSFYVFGNDRSADKTNNKGSEGVSPDSIVTGFFDADGDVDADDAVFWEGDINLPKPNVRVSGEVATDNEPDVEYRSPLFVELDFQTQHAPKTDCEDQSKKYTKANCMAETKEYAKDNFDTVSVTLFELDGVDMTEMVKTTDGETFLVSLENVSVGDHTIKIQAIDQAGNTLEDTLEIDFEVSDRDPFEKRLNPGWNLVSLPGEPADSSIAAVFGSGVEVRTVYTYDPVVPGGWQVAVRETLDSDWQGDLTEITGQRGYWVLSDAIQDWDINIPRLAGGAAGTGTPIQPPSIALYAGWNLIPVTDVTGEFKGDGISVEVYLDSLDDGLDLARVLGFNTIKNEWMTLGLKQKVEFGHGYWVFVREAGTLVPGQ